MRELIKLTQNIQDKESHLDALINDLTERVLALTIFKSTLDEKDREYIEIDKSVNIMSMVLLAMRDLRNDILKDLEDE